MNRTSRAALTAAFSLASALAASAAAAQSPEAAEGLQLEEIVVTARKREESLQDVPIAVTALSAQRIEELRITSPDDIARFTPGFSFSSGFGRSGGERPTIRGQTNILGAPNASFFVDGIYVSGRSLSTETSNLERIEVIKGPQAALYGRATFAGAINYITKRPSNDFTGKLSVTGGQHDEREASGFVSGPIVEDRLLYYVGARTWRFDGGYTNAFDGGDAGAQRSNSGTVKLLWTPNEAFEATLLGTLAKDDDPGALPIVLLGRQFNNCQLRVVSGSAANNFAGTILPRSPGYYCGEAPGASDLGLQIRQRSDVLPGGLGSWRGDKRLGLTTRTTFGGGYQLTTVTGYHEEDGGSRTDVSYDAYDAFANLFGSSQSGAFWGSDSFEREDFQQEIRLDSPAERAFRWRLGGYYFKGNADTLSNKKYLAPGSALQANCVTLPGGFIQCPQSTVEPLSETELENRAVFGDIEYDVTDRFTITAELRRATEEAEQLNIQAVTTLPGCNPMAPTNTPGVTIDLCRFKGEWKSTTPRVTLRYKATPDATFYLNAAKGTKPGGFNTATAVQTGINSRIDVPAVYEEEESKAYELGAKLVLFDRRATLNAALFYTEITGQQLTSNVVGVTAAGAASVNSFITNLGGTEVKGLELDGTLLISDRWDAQFTFSWVDSKIESFLDNNQANLFSPNPAFSTAPSSSGPRTLCNNRPPAPQVPGREFCDVLIAADLAAWGNVAGAFSPRTPKIQASLASSYRGEFGNGWGWRIAGDVTYEGKRYGQVDNLNRTPAHTYVGARLSLSDENWELTLWGKNLFDDDGPIDILRYIDSRGITPATFFTPAIGGVTPRGFGLSLPRPRQVGLTAAYRF
jgi:outer membrane receptor protein involved in Fe transport